MRRFPFFVIPGSGKYRLQPIFVDDLAALAVEAGRRSDDYTLDTIGPETYTFAELVSLIAHALGRRARILHVSPTVAFALTRALGALVRDVVLTKDEIEGLTAGLLATASLPAATTRLSEWLCENASLVGQRYASELDRHYRPRAGSPT